MDATRFACSLPPTSSISQPHPWLLICHGKRQQTQTFFGISHGRRVVRTIPELFNKTIWTCCNEWLVLADPKASQLSLLSLTSMETIQLPQIKFKLELFDRCLLSSPPTSPDCRILIFYGTPNNLLIYCKPGDSEFKVQEFHMVNRGWGSPIAFNGDIYVTNFNYELYMIDFGTIPEQPRLIQITHESLPSQQPSDIVSTESLLVESNGEILHVTVMYYGIGMSFEEIFGFLIFQFDFVEKEWVKLRSLGKSRALFINKYWGVSCLAAEESESGVKGNSIYFVKECDRCIYVFDMEKKTISFFMPCQNVGRRRSKFQWINLPPALSGVSEDQPPSSHM